MTRPLGSISNVSGGNRPGKEKTRTAVPGTRATGDASQQLYGWQLQKAWQLPWVTRIQPLIPTEVEPGMPVTPGRIRHTVMTSSQSLDLINSGHNAHF